MSFNYEDLYVGDLSKFARQVKLGTWANTAKAAKEWPKGIPGQASTVALIVGTPFKRKDDSPGILTRYGEEIARHRHLLRRRGRAASTERLPRYAVAAEHLPPTGQAYGWYQEVIHYVPLSGMHVAKQIARLCGDDSMVTIPWRSLSDAVGVADRIGRERAYTERGVQALVDSGWLTVETIGSKRGAKTTFYLQVGDHSEQARRMARESQETYDLFSEDDFLEEE